MNPLMGNNVPGIMQMLPQFKQNAVGILRQVGYKIPDGITDPNQIINQLVSSGQLNNGRLGQIVRMMRGRF